LLLPVAMVAAFNAAAVVTWAAYAGRLPLLNSWEVYFLVLALVPALGLAVHCGTGLHPVSAVALGLTLIGGIGLRFLPASARIVRPPVAILQSGWREVHILSTMTAYASLFLVTGLCATLLVRPAQREIQRLARRILLVGIWLLGVGIATGAAWAHEAWGRYWGWDPKEVWALVAWLVFVGAAHARAGGAGATRGWAVLVILGFAALLFTFLGVTFLLPGLHSYG
jgi:ABC-type transport system involved in cytochrome c biogenesis permease subunit